MAFYYYRIIIIVIIITGIIGAFIDSVFLQRHRRPPQRLTTSGARVVVLDRFGLLLRCLGPGA